LTSLEPTGEDEGTSFSTRLAAAGDPDAKVDPGLFRCSYSHPTTTTLQGAGQQDVAAFIGKLIYCIFQTQIRLSQFLRY
jgi:hypothetical protein